VNEREKEIFSSIVEWKEAKDSDGQLIVGGITRERPLLAIAKQHTTLAYSLQISDELASPRGTVAGICS
jgi:hypothetical protein